MSGNQELYEHTNPILGNPGQLQTLFGPFECVEGPATFISTSPPAFPTRV